MGRPPTGNPTGHPLLTIDWKQVDKMLVGGANGVQIAAQIGMSPDTLYRRCSDEHGVTFTVYSQEKRAIGDALLHAKQFDIAMRGNTTMLKHLGEHRLGQKSSATKEELKDIIDGLKLAIRESEERPRHSKTQGPPLETQQPLLDQGCSGESHQVSDELGSERFI